MQKSENKYEKNTDVSKWKLVFALQSFSKARYFFSIRAMKNNILSVVFPHSNFKFCWDHCFPYGWTKEKDKKFWQHFLGCWSQQDGTAVPFQPACSGTSSRALQKPGHCTGSRMLLPQHPGVKGLGTMFALLIQGSNLTAGPPTSSWCSHLHETTWNTDYWH